MSYGSRRFPHQHGRSSPSPSRYVVLYSAQIFWLLLGFWFYHRASWPSSCMPDDLVEVYSCSMRLPESGRWREAVLLTWLWATPILVLLEISRWVGGGQRSC